MSSTTLQPASCGCEKRRAFSTAMGDTSTMAVFKPAAAIASVTARTPSSFAATIIAATSPSGAVPRNWWSQTISSIGNGTFCSTS